jgi:hypothetical protein
MKEITLDNWEEKPPSKGGPKNIFQIWRETGENVPFAVRRDNWAEHFYTVVEKIEIKKWPYGNAFGYPTINGRYSNHYEYAKEWKTERKIPCAGCYQWTLVEDVLISKDFSVLDSALPLKKSLKMPKPVIPEKTQAYTFDKIHVDYPKAYAKWSQEDDEKLKDLFVSGKTEDELALIFQRKIGAIESRLKKLGLKTSINDDSST